MNISNWAVAPSTRLEFRERQSRLAFLFATWLLAPRLEVFAIESVDSGIDSTARTAGAGEDARFWDRLLALMRDERAYRQEGLTIAVLSRKLDMPEYRLRRVLADPAQGRRPILNLALDLGYGSPGAFNRAFRAKTGQTPTEFRRARLAES